MTNSVVVGCFAYVSVVYMSHSFMANW